MASRSKKARRRRRRRRRKRPAKQVRRRSSQQRCKLSLLSANLFSVTFLHGLKVVTYDDPGGKGSDLGLASQTTPTLQAAERSQHNKPGNQLTGMSTFHALCITLTVLVFHSPSSQPTHLLGCKLYMSLVLTQVMMAGDM